MFYVGEPCLGSTRYPNVSSGVGWEDAYIVQYQYQSNQRTVLKLYLSAARLEQQIPFRHSPKGI